MNTNRLFFSSVIALAAVGCGGTVQVGNLSDSGAHDHAVDSVVETGGEDAQDTGVAKDVVVEAGQCSWPSSLDPVDGGDRLFSGAYYAVRWMLDCKLPSGAGGSCSGNSPTPPKGCGGPLAGATCTSHCAETDYVVTWQDVGDMPPFPACTPAGTDPDQSFFCCPCGTGTDGG